MNDRRVISAALMLTLVLATAACAHLKSDVDPEAITDADSLVEYLRENEVSLLEHGPIVSPQLSVPGYEYTPTSGGTLQVFKYPTDADALTDVVRLERGRDVRQAWQLYRKADLVVLYRGDDPRIERALIRVFGSRIA